MPPLAIPPASMNAVLQHGIGVSTAGMRTRLIAAGFRDLQALIDKGDDYATKVCNNVRKSSGGNANDKNVSVLVEEPLYDQYSK